MWRSCEKVVDIYVNNNLDILIKTDENILMLATDNYKTDYTDEIEFFSNIKQKGEIQHGTRKSNNHGRLRSRCRSLAYRRFRPRYR